jgi:hypothetical protein
MPKALIHLWFPDSGSCCRLLQSRVASTELSENTLGKWRLAILVSRPTHPPFLDVRSYFPFLGLRCNFGDRLLCFASTRHRGPWFWVEVRSGSVVKLSLGTTPLFRALLLFLLDYRRGIFHCAVKRSSCKVARRNLGNSGNVRGMDCR